MGKKLGDARAIYNEAVYNDNPEWKAADFKTAIRFEGLPKSLQQKLRRLRETQTTVIARLSKQRG